MTSTSSPAAAGPQSRPDYSLYLVTDVTPAILGTRDLATQVRAAVAGGATIVQHRDKHSSTATLISTAHSLHAITRQYNIPLLINDRVDVAQAIDAEGVHLGQDDMPLATARKILGPGKIIGITVSNAQEARLAIAGGADYVGIGTMFGTATKTDTKEIIGPGGTQAVLGAVAEAEAELQAKAGAGATRKRVGAVAIGGINASNVQRVLYQSVVWSQTPTKTRALDGVAVVSALMSASDPKASAGHLRRLIATYETEPPPFATLVYPAEVPSADLIEAYLARDVPALIARVRTTKPLCHNMTNLVVQNFAANVALAVGGSPIMAGDGAEATDLAKLGGNLVVNMGSATPGAVEHASKAVAAYNAVGGPVLLDPVGGGATAVRREGVRKLLVAGYYDVIKGNESEILAVARAFDGVVGATTEQQQQQQRGVDSAASGMTLRQKAQVVHALAERQRCVVLMTGEQDLLADGVRVLRISNGHPLLGEITGSGCTLGTVVAAMLAGGNQNSGRDAGGSGVEEGAGSGDKLLAVLAGCLLFEIAAELAVEGLERKKQQQQQQGGEGVAVGPGSFVPAFIDALASLSKGTTNGGQGGDGSAGTSGGAGWLARAKVDEVDLLANGSAVVKEG